MHRRGRVSYDQISAVSANENKHAHQLQTSLMRHMILKLHGNETCSSCDLRLFFSLGTSRRNETRSSCDQRLFFSLIALRLIVASCLNISKKKISSGTQGILSLVIGLNYDDTLITDFFFQVACNSSFKCLKLVYDCSNKHFWFLMFHFSYNYHIQVSIV